MKNRIVFLIELFLVGGLLGASALAQTAARFTIPFAFTANNFAVPAGQYEVRLGIGAQYITVLNRQDGHTMFLPTRHETGVTVEPVGVMTFLVNGNDYVLKEIRMPGSTQCAQFLVPHVYELKTAQNQPPVPSTIQIAAR
ncbi:MAG: hypothetical protein ACLGXA_19360 [Acidobacteriota bacterium]